MPNNRGIANASTRTPQAVDDFAFVLEDGTVTVDVLDNDRGGNSKTLLSVDQSALTAAGASGTLASGALVSIVDGEVVYDPNGAFDYLGEGETGTDTFFYSVQMGNGLASTGMVTVTVVGTNDGPVGVADSYTLDEDTVLTADAATGVLGNDVDPDGDPMTATLVDGPTHGTLVLNADGSFTYTPDANYGGSDSFTYTASDGTETTDPITVDLTINDVIDVIGFDDLAHGTFEPGGYFYLDWGNFIVGNVDTLLDDPTDGASYVDSGYITGLISPGNVGVNAFGTPSTISAPEGETFDLISAYMTSAWNIGMTVQVEGYRGADLAYFDEVTISDDVATEFVFNYEDVTSVTFTSFGGVDAGTGGFGTQIVFDNFVIL
jgi:VCBS repeat-containing protein